MTAAIRAGWDDASAAQTDDQTRMKADLARNLQTLGFTYHEARTPYPEGDRAADAAGGRRLLPEIARESLAPHGRWKP